MRVPVNRLLKSEIIWLGTHMCKHNHSFLEHYNCFIKENPGSSPIQPEVIGFLDIETSNFQATYGYIFSYAIKQLGGKIYGRAVNSQEARRGIFDKQLMTDLIKDLKHFDRVITYYGKRFDIPYIRTRAIKWGLEFPRYRELFSTDVYFMVKSLLRLHNNRLATACGVFNIPCKQHAGIAEVWVKASAGDKKALAWIWEHNKEDVVSLEELWEKLKTFGTMSKTSI